MTPQLLCDQAVRLHQEGRLDEAERLYRQAVADDATLFGPRHYLGLLLLQRGRNTEALEMIGAALALNPGSTEALIHYGNAQKILGQAEEALASFAKAAMLDPALAGAPYNRAILLADLGRVAEALEAYGAAIALKPDFTGALFDRAVLLQAQGRNAEALADCNALLASAPDHGEGLNARGVILMELHQPEAALADFDRALAIMPAFAEALHNRGNALNSLKRYPEALASYDRALALKPQAYARAWTNRAILLQNMRRFEEALSSFDRALAIEPNNAEALQHRGRLAWAEFQRYDQAVADLEKAVAAAPDYPYAAGHLLYLKMQGGDWRGREQEIARIEAGIQAGKPMVEPFIYQAISGSPANLQACAEIHAAHRHPAFAPMQVKKRGPGKIRIGYVSGEFREQATAYLTAGLYECHDKSQFQIVAFDNGKNDGSALRRRLEAAFDQWVDISTLSDQAAAQAIADAGIDILVNLNGYFGERRTGIFAHKPAPIQVNYLGFPGTLGAPYMDYIIADRIVIPEDERRCFTEKVVWLPDSYQVNDAKRAIAEAPTRAELGLPDKSFVFCCFNQSYKLAPETFAAWMRILKSAPGSVLWLMQSHPRHAENIRREAEAAGVAGGRIIFSPMITNEKHLARLQRADLFLDTLPYNAHTTAADALWAGLPLLTCPGTAFAGRVAASLLTALDMPELIAPDMAAFEAQAVKLASEPVHLYAVREKLAANRLNAALFDTARFTRHLEAAYAAMVERHEKGLKPENFAVGLGLC